MVTSDRKKLPTEARKTPATPLARVARTGVTVSSLENELLKQPPGRNVAARKAAASKVGAKGTETAAAKEDASGKAVVKVARKAIAKNAAAHILSAPKGPRTLSHRQIKQAVKSVFQDRYGVNA